MKLTNKSEYALLALAYLARQQPDLYVSGDEIASAQQIPKKFLQQILHALIKGGIVRALKGRGGGYALSSDPAQISVAEVVRLFEGALAPTKSASKFFYEPSPIEREAKVLKLFKEVRKLVAQKLEATTLADLV